jgi:penicillin-binding protein 1C
LGFAALWLTAWLVPLPDKIKPKYSHGIYSQDGQLLRGFLSHDEKWRFPLDPQQAWPHWLPEALMYLEDKRFAWHPGFDPFAIMRAVKQNRRSGKNVSGASTLTMQLARLLEPRPRTMQAKIRELLRSIQLSIRFSKNEILKLYLTYAPYGRNLEGLEAAAQYYFAKSSSRISHGEFAFLASLPQAPDRARANHRTHWRTYQQRTIRAWRRCKILSDDETQRAEATEVPKSFGFPPVKAAHFAQWLKEQYPQNSRQVSTLDLAMQDRLEQFVLQAREDLRRSGIHNIAILVAKQDDGSLKAAIGNFNYLDASHDQALNSFALPRSPGSTLKPFLYALAIEQGQMLPETMLPDVPMAYHGYSPQNFDGTFRGLLSAKDTLLESLNLPFVNLLEVIGMDPFLSYLEAGGMPLTTQRSSLGLSAIIGAMDASPLEILQLYNSMANGGQYLPIRGREDAPSQAAPWMHPVAAYLTNQSLGAKNRPDFPNSSQYLPTSRSLHWKTGTSQGRRDAWAVGYDSKHTVVVWLGNLNNFSSQSLVGATSAGPLLFRIFENIGIVNPGAKAPPTMAREIEVCAFSGMTSTGQCPLTKHVIGINKILPHCPYHQKVLLDQATGLRLDPDCAVGRASDYKNFLIFPAAIAKWFRGMPRYAETIPPFHPSCSRRISSHKAQLTIESPRPGTIYHLWKSDGSLDIPLRLQSLSSLTNCFHNGRQLDTLRPQDYLGTRLTVNLGKHQLYCVGTEGESQQSTFWVTR